MKRQPTEREKIFVNDMTNKVLIAIIHINSSYEALLHLIFSDVDVSPR